MLAIIGTLLYAMKAVVTVEARATGGRRLAGGAGWASPPSGRACGRGPSPGPSRARCRGLQVSSGWGRPAGAGPALVALARLAWVGTGSRMLATGLLMPGLSLVVHFGVFNVLAGAWRRAGVDCRPLFAPPLRSTSLGEFWGRRWNLAFSQMTALAIYQPLLRRAAGGRRWPRRSSARGCCTSWPSACRSWRASACRWPTSPCTGR